MKSENIEVKKVHEEMPVTVLMATYQGKAYVRQQLDSILSQTVPVRIIISDDGSTDGTQRILEDYQEMYPERISLRHHRKPQTEGASAFSSPAADNFFWLLSVAFQDEACAYILLSDQDDVWFPDKVETLLGRIRRLEARLGTDHPVLVHSDMEVSDYKLEQISPSFFAYARCNPGRVMFPEILVENPVTGGALMMNRALLNLVWPRPRACCMHDWWIALAASCFGTISCVRRPLSQYRQHDQNLVGAAAIGSARELADRLRRQRKVQENYWRMLAQAAAFDQRFHDKLTREQKKVLKAFLTLPRQTPPARLVSIVKNQFYKTSPVQTLAMCLTIPHRRKDGQKGTAK